MLVAALYLLLPRLVDTQQTLQLLQQANYWLLALAVILEALAIVAYANLTRFILAVLAVKLRLFEVLSITLSSLAVSHVLSAGGVGGWVVTYNALMKRKVPHGLIFVAIAAQQFFNYIVLWFVFALALIYLVVARHESIASYVGGIILIALLLWLTAYGIYLYRRPTRLRRRVGQIATLINRITRRETIQERHLDGWMDNLFAGMRRMTSHRGAFRKATVFACGFWLFDMLCLFVTFMAFGHGIGLSTVAIAFVVAYAIGTLAPTPGGLGAVEGLLIALFVSFGVPSATAVTVVLVYRLINFWLPIIPGLIAYVLVRPGRKPIAEGEVELAAEEVCGVTTPTNAAGLRETPPASTESSSPRPRDARTSNETSDGNSHARRNGSNGRRAALPGGNGWRRRLSLRGAHKDDAASTRTTTEPPQDDDDFFNE
ncbi:MAG: lysylphosphatidylglycerol synthase transmembrane domain-containing protein [Thermoleophilia bacterium]